MKYVRRLCDIIKVIGGLPTDGEMDSSSLNFTQDTNPDASLGRIHCIIQDMSFCEMWILQYKSTLAD